MLHDILKNKLYHMIFKNKKNWLLSYIIVIKIKEKRRCQFKNNISSYCRSSPSSGQDSN